MYLYISPVDNTFSSYNLCHTS